MLYNLTADIHVLCKHIKTHYMHPRLQGGYTGVEKNRTDLKFFCAILPTELFCTGDSEFEYGGGLRFQVTPAESEKRGKQFFPN